MPSYRSVAQIGRHIFEEAYPTMTSCEGTRSQLHVESLEGSAADFGNDSVMEEPDDDEVEHHKEERTRRRSSSMSKKRKERRHRRSSSTRVGDDCPAKKNAGETAPTTRGRSMADICSRQRTVNKEIMDDFPENSPAPTKTRSSSLSKIKNKRSRKLRNEHRRHHHHHHRSSQKSGDKQSTVDDEIDDGGILREHGSNTHQEQRRKHRRKSRRSIEKGGTAGPTTCNNSLLAFIKKCDEEAEDSDASGKSRRSFTSLRSAPPSMPTHVALRICTFGKVESGEEEDDDDDDSSVEFPLPGFATNFHLRKVLADNMHALEQSKNSLKVDSMEEGKEQENEEIESSPEDEDAEEEGEAPLVALDFSRDANLRKVLADGMEAMEQSLTSVTFDPNDDKEEEENEEPLDNGKDQNSGDDSSVELIALDFSGDEKLRKILADGIEAMERNLLSFNLSGDVGTQDEGGFQQQEPECGDFSGASADEKPTSSTSLAGDNCWVEAVIPDTPRTMHDSVNSLRLSDVVQFHNEDDDQSEISSPRRGSFRFGTNRVNRSFQNLKDALNKSAKRRLSKSSPALDFRGAPSAALIDYMECASDDELDEDKDIDRDVSSTTNPDGGGLTPQLGQSTDVPPPSPHSQSRRLQFPQRMGFMSRRKRGASESRDSADRLEESHGAAASPSAATALPYEDSTHRATTTVPDDSASSPRSVTAVGKRLGSTFQLKLQALGRDKTTTSTSCRSISDFRRHEETNYEEDTDHKSVSERFTTKPEGTAVPLAHGSAMQRKGHGQVSGERSDSIQDPNLEDVNHESLDNPDEDVDVQFSYRTVDQYYS